MTEIGGKRVERADGAQSIIDGATVGKSLQIKIIRGWERDEHGHHTRRTRPQVTENEGGGKTKGEERPCEKTSKAKPSRWLATKC